jgi:hypothetical protein
MPGSGSNSQVLSLDLTAEGTAGCISRSDRQLVGNCYQEGVTIEEIETAFFLKMARRRFRDPALPLLDSIRSFHYVVPVLEEARVKFTPMDDVGYLRHKLTRSGDEI